MISRLSAAPLPLICVTLLAFVGGCASAPRADAPESVDAPSSNAPARDPRSLDTFMGASALPVTWDALVAQAASADVVLIGEMHGHVTGLAFAEALFADVVARRPNTACLSMEFFERDHQLALDDYLAGITEETTFRRNARRTDGNYPPAHRAMVESARDHDRPVVAANAPRRYVRMARIEGFEALQALNDRQRALFDIPEALTEGRYKEKFYGLMSGMGGHGEETEEDPVLAFYRSQNLWDETMAVSIADALRDGSAPVVHVVGQFHSDERGGLVTRLERLAPDARILVITTVDAWSGELREEDTERADVVVYVGPRG